jgi:hypothetical protein
MASETSERCPTCGSAMLVLDSFTGTHETGSRTCLARAAQRRLDAEELEPVRDPETIQRLLELGADPQYVRLALRSTVSTAARTFVAPRWLIVIEDAGPTRSPAATEIVSMFEKSPELRAAVVAVSTLSSNKKEGRAAVRAFIREELARWRRT